MQSFEDLKIRKSGINISKKIYVLVRDPCFDKDWSLKDQMKRCSVSISSNIAEWFERQSNKEYARFLYIAKGSCGELRSQLYLAKELYNIEIKEIYEECIIVSKQIQSLINKIKQQY